MEDGTDKPKEENARSATRRQRELLAEFCRDLRAQLSGEEPETTVLAGTHDSTPPEQGASREPGAEGLSPREGQTLELLLAGEGEKQIAARLKISQHTVHGYVKSVYRRFDVSSRAELLALWVRKG